MSLLGGRSDEPCLDFIARLALRRLNDRIILALNEIFRRRGIAPDTFRLNAGRYDDIEDSVKALRGPSRYTILFYSAGGSTTLVRK